MTVRSASINDIKNLLKHDVHISEKQLGKCISDNRVFVAEDDGRFVGWLRYSLFWDSIPFMNMLYLVDSERGKGYGKALVKHFEIMMRKYGFDKVMTSTASDEFAQHFYHKLGYKTVGGFLLDGDVYETVLYKKL